MHCSIEKTPQLLRDRSTTTWHHPTLLFLHILAVQEPFLHSIRSLGFHIASASLNTNLSTQEWPSRVNNSSNNSSALYTLVLATIHLSSVALYHLTGLSSRRLWMEQTLEAWRRSVALFGLQWAKREATTLVCHIITGSTTLVKMAMMEALEKVWVSRIFFF